MPSSGEGWMFDLTELVEEQRGINGVLDLLEACLDKIEVGADAKLTALLADTRQCTKKVGDHIFMR